MNKRVYSQPMVKVISMAIYGDVCEEQRPASEPETVYGPAPIEPLF